MKSLICFGFVLSVPTPIFLVGGSDEIGSPRRHCTQCGADVFVADSIGLFDSQDLGEDSLNLLQRRAALLTPESASGSSKPAPTLTHDGIASGALTLPIIYSVAQAATVNNLNLLQAEGVWNTWLKTLGDIGIESIPRALKQSSATYTTTQVFIPNVRLSIGYCIREEWWPCLMLVLSGTFLYIGLWRRVLAADNAEGARSVALVVQFMNFMGFTIAIIDSYDVATMIGGDITYSGAIIGCFMCGSGVGFFLSWVILSLYPNIWRSHIRTMLCSAIAFGILGEFCYNFICWLVPIAGEANVDLAAIRGLLLVARACTGIGQGMTALIVRVMFVRLTPADHRLGQSVRFMFATVFGMGVGPLVAAVAQFGKEAGAAVQIDFQHVGVVACGFQVISMICMTLFPDISNELDQIQLQADTDPATTRSISDGSIIGSIDVKQTPVSGMGLGGFTKKRIVLTCLTLVTIRSYVVAGLESTTAVLLQLQFDWTTTNIGLWISATFLVSVPVNMAFFWTKESFTPRQWLLLIMVVAVLGTVFLLPLKCFESGWWILLSDTIIFPTMSLGDGMLIGQMDMYKFPEGTLFNVNNRALLTGFLCNGVARLAGPICARLIYQQYGQFGYAIQQLGMLTLCCLIFLTILCYFGMSEESLQKMEASPEKEEGAKQGATPSARALPSPRSSPEKQPEPARGGIWRRLEAETVEWSRD